MVLSRGHRGGKGGVAAVRGAECCPNTLGIQGIWGHCPRIDGVGLGAGHGDMGSTGGHYERFGIS